MKYVISYVSTASSELTDSDIRSLFNFVNDFNNKEGITGILIFSNGNFFQILEGEQKIVSLVFEKIKKDIRHHSIIKMLDKEITTSSFFGYTSSFTSEFSDYPLEIPKSIIKQNTQSEHYKSTMYLLQKFLSLS